MSIIKRFHCTKTSMDVSPLLSSPSPPGPSCVHLLLAFQTLSLKSKSDRLERSKCRGTNGRHVLQLVAGACPSSCAEGALIRIKS